MTKQQNGNGTLGVLTAARAIGEFIGAPGRPVHPRRVLYLAEQQMIRTFHVARTLRATEETLREDMTRFQSGEGR